MPPTDHTARPPDAATSGDGEAALMRASEAADPVTGTNPATTTGTATGTATGTGTGTKTRTGTGAAPHDLRRHDPLGHAAVPRGMQVAAGWSWRLLVVAGAIGVIVYVIATLHLVIVPMMVAILITALVQPIAAALVRRGVPNALAATVVMIGSFSVIGLLVWVVVHEFQRGWDDLVNQVDGGVDKIQNWLMTGPFQLSQAQLDSAVESARTSFEENRETFTAGALSTATTVGHVVTGALLTLFATFFLLKDGARIWAWVVKLFPKESEPHAHAAGVRAWRTLISYVRATIAVAAVDAIGIGVSVALLGVPLALPLGVLVFLGAFVPIIGALLTGMVAVLVALFAKGVGTALLVLAAVIAVQQIEGHVLQPLLLGRAVEVHPLAVVFSIAAGVLLAGIVGALVAVPLVAVANTVTSYLTDGELTIVPTEPAPPGAPPDAGASPDPPAGPASG